MDKLLIFGYGNLSRGDDALGPLVIETLLEWQQEHNWTHIQALTDYQLQIEHTLDLDNQDLVVFVDADVSCQTPFTVSICDPQVNHSYTSHALNPSALLAVYRQVHRINPPKSYTISIRGQRFGLGQPLSISAKKNLAAAITFIDELCRSSLLGHAQALCDNAAQTSRYA